MLFLSTVNYFECKITDEQKNAFLHFAMSVFLDGASVSVCNLAVAQILNHFSRSKKP